MSDLFSYRLENFALYSEEVFLATLIDYNQSIFPAQLLFSTASAFLIFVIIKNHKIVPAFIRVYAFVVFPFLYFVLVSSFLEHLNWSFGYFKWSLLTLPILFLRKFETPSKKRKLIGLAILVFAAFLPIPELLIQNEPLSLAMVGWGALRTLLGFSAIAYLYLPKINQALIYIISLIWVAHASFFYLAIAQ